MNYMHSPCTTDIPILVRRSSERRGAVLLVVLVCLMVVGVVGMGLVRTMITAGHDKRLHADRLQTQWLAESGLDRGVARLRRDASFEAETWRIDADQLDGRRSAVVEIVVEASSVESFGRRITAVATLGEGPLRISAEATRGVVLETPEESP
ncbi:MAG: hypothetical protein RIC55_19045 [Pirellulaceae bacterium]